MNAFTQPPLALLLAFTATWGWLWLLHRWAPFLRLLDRPGGRKQHAQPTPMVGGIAMFLAFWPAMLLFERTMEHLERFFLVTLLVVCIGTWDDAMKLRVRYRFGAELAMGLFMSAGGGVTVVTLGDLVGMGELLLGWFAVPFSVICFIGVINALNMADGVDGLAAGTTLVSASLMMLLAWWNQRTSEAWTLGLFLTVIIPFFCVNARMFRKTAWVFLGDAGSLFLGTTLAWFTMTLSQGEHPAFKPVVALWLVAVPLIEMFSSFLRRILAGRSPFSPDRHHAHHLLRQLQFSDGAVTAILMGATLIFALIGITLERLGVAEVHLFIGLLVLYALYCAITIHFWKHHA
ncbi:MAG: undecaprenyl/decaprenyl-phosphate alpha-N-acetylglucosaminyl 1-phosphate transferase [Magnetococcales bacterium]|nr:undecaprenyl/decaprenyl-phosphate alpha-N-acetylglucosaminyl 1-phosphate transferase [Magnetococcales bacterium]MBF0150905.1 undecaprenyl/decaprenyl-phosphate alpha-N-acetylglucosaminyl 1-phosphate transferase [Magnetococcales bacterium]MBF0631453.1 undecaprenyl/decaprenyl-phosphate alpha-N-acetylglucosaminyl 1-phosphate transferase [Magnetococcales bacterium]